MANKRSSQSKQGNYSDLDKAAARTLINSGQMGIRAVSDKTGISRNTIREWVRKDPDSNVEYLSGVLTAGMLNELKGLSSLCIRELSNRLQDKELSSTREVMDSMKQTMDAMIGLMNTVKPAPPKETTETDYWRGVVSRLLLKAQAKGESVSYEDAVQKVIEIRPEAAPYLTDIETTATHVQ